MSFFDEPDIDLDGHGDCSAVPARRARRAAAAVLAAGLVVTVLFVVRSSSAVAEPSVNDWYRLRMCESGDNYQINTGNGHYGAYQFDLATWRSVGGSGLPSDASRAEQDKRALLLYRQRGWQPWQCASILGLPVRSGPSGGQHGWPGASYSYGDNNSQIARWQKQMRDRGAPLQGTGQFGPITLSVVKALQRQNGLPGEGTLGPLTWNLAWTGHYRHGGTTSRGATVPKWPGAYYSQGQHNEQIARWQKQMHQRGAPLQGTGQFGPVTVSVVKALQRQNGLDAVGFIGPNTWALAWTGTYHR